MLSFYRTKSALQIKLIQPELDESKRFLKKEGSILLEFAKGDDRKYDWKNKLMFSLNTADLPILFTAFEGIKSKGTLPKNEKGEEVIQIIHKYNDTSKTLTLKKAEKSGYFLSIYQNKESISVSLSYGEILMLYYFLINIGFDIIRIK